MPRRSNTVRRERLHEEWKAKNGDARCVNDPVDAKVDAASSTLKALITFVRKTTSNVERRGMAAKWTTASASRKQP